MNCEGLACGEVDIFWDSVLEAYRVKNRSDRRVFVALTSSSGKVSVRLDSGADTVVYVAQFDLPYQAFYCD